jgi:hypothetical protein
MKKERVTVYKIPTFSLIHVIVLTAMLFFAAWLYALPVKAQDEGDKGPDLIYITLSDEERNEEAENIVRKIYEDLARQTDHSTEIGKIRARYVPFERNGSDSKFILGVLDEQPYGGCFRRGCMTVILHSTGNNQWSSVFGAFVHGIWYDKTSKATRHANLILSSNTDGSDPGVWMWNGQRYQLINR